MRSRRTVAYWYCAVATSSEFPSCWTWSHTCCASARLELTEGSANAGTAATRAMQIPARTYGACPFLLITTPGEGPGRAHREGPVRHEFSRLPRLSDERQPKSPATVCRNMFISARSTVLLQRDCGTVRVRAWAGTHAAAASIAARRNRPGSAGHAGCWRSRFVAIDGFATRRIGCTRGEITQRGARAVFARPAAR